MARPTQTKLGRIPHGDVPASFHVEVSRRLAPYCVALARMSSDDTDTFQIIGSGTLVVRDGQHGVLTAHHCLHGLGRKLRVGDTGTDRIFLITSRGYTPFAAQHELTEQVLGSPRNKRYGPNGPDLTFIQIPLGPMLSSLKAFASFCPLNRDPEMVARKFCVERAYFANLGFPEHGMDVKRSKKEVRANVTLLAGAGSFRREDVKRRGAWDYINCPCDYRAYPHLPKKHAGMSGGGIWAVLFTRKDGHFEIYDFALIGVTFYQTRIRRGRCQLRGHFVRSIYRRAWRKAPRRVNL